MTTTAKLVTRKDHLASRKELALMIGVSADCVRRNEVLWGIVRYRRTYNHRLILYRVRPVMIIFERLGLLK